MINKSDSRCASSDFVITRMITDRIGLHSVLLPLLIIKITISSVLIGLKKAYFPPIRLPSCYRTVCYWIVCYWTVCDRTVQKANHIQRCSLKQPITFKVVITCACTCACFCVFAFFFPLVLYFNENFPFFSQLGYFSRKL